MRVLVTRPLHDARRFFVVDVKDEREREQGLVTIGRDERDAGEVLVVAMGLDLAALILAVVADKTGYPAEMINLDMDLEADLGIDSIKRVEILSM